MKREDIVFVYDGQVASVEDADPPSLPGLPSDLHSLQKWPSKKAKRRVRQKFQNRAGLCYT